MTVMDQGMPLRQRLERYNRPTVRRAVATAAVSGAAFAGLYYLARQRRRKQQREQDQEQEQEQDQWVEVPVGEVVETVIIQPL